MVDSGLNILKFYLSFLDDFGILDDVEIFDF